MKQYHFVLIFVVLIIFKLFKQVLNCDSDKTASVLRNWPFTEKFLEFKPLKRNTFVYLAEQCICMVHA